MLTQQEKLYKGTCSSKAISNGLVTSQFVRFKLLATTVHHAAFFRCPRLPCFPGPYHCCTSNIQDQLYLYHTLWNKISLTKVNGLPIDNTNYISEEDDSHTNGDCYTATSQHYYDKLDDGMSTPMDGNTAVLTDSFSPPSSKQLLLQRRSHPLRPKRQRYAFALVNDFAFGRETDNFVVY